MDSPFALPVELTPLANNREQALKRAKSFDLSLKRDPNKQQHTLEFMQKMFDNGHAEITSPVDEKTEHWYLPLFSIYHPKNPDSVRVVFDSAVKFHSSSLNDVLMKGTPLHNSLLGILLRNYGMWNKCSTTFMCSKDTGTTYGSYGMKETALPNPL